MPCLVWDIETRSTVDLEVAGAWRYAADPTTEPMVVAYAVDAAAPQIWIPGQPIPSPFLEAAHDPRWLVIAHNAMFERAILTRLLGPRFRWPQIPVEQWRDTMSLALASALPGALDAVAVAVGLPLTKDREGYRLMRTMSRPRRARKGEDPNALHWVDGPEQREALHRYCVCDVETERALFYVLPPLSDAEQDLWQLDAIINERGFPVDVALAQAARDVARAEQAALDLEVARHTENEITSVHQRDRIVAFVRRRGHALEALTKRSVAAVLAHDPGDAVRHLLELRQQGALASVRKFERLLKSVDADCRVRGGLRFHGSATGRWSGRGYQPQNLRKPEGDLDAAVEAILGGDLEQIRQLGAPLTVAGDVSRAMICAAPGHVLVGADFSSVESRTLAWLAREEWKLDVYRKYDATKDPALEPYCVGASKVLRRPVTPDDVQGRELGKVLDLAFGFGGGLGAWRRFDTSDTYSDTHVEVFKVEWRRAHQATERFWKGIKRAALQAVITGHRIDLGRLSFAMQGTSLLMTLPSGRSIAYPEARLGPGRFDGHREVHFKDNAHGGWSDCRSWYGTLTENAVQAVARDLLAAAMQRIEHAGYPVVLHVHDEVVCETPEGRGGSDEFLRLMTEPPGWAEGLPIAAKVWSGPRYAKSKGKTKTTTVSPVPITTEPTVVTATVAEPITATESEDDAEDPGADVPLADLIGEPLVDGKICCPYHDDSTPSCHVYDDHYHCFGCGAHGDRFDWLRDVEGLEHDEAVKFLADWRGPVLRPRQEDELRTLAMAMRLWDGAQPITGTLAVRYLAEVRRIDVDALPANVEAVLRFHPRCPFGPGAELPALLALYRDVTSDAPAGIHRIALTPDVFAGGKVRRRMLGHWSAPRAVKLWPAGERLFVGEGLETVLAAATRLAYRGQPMQPAWVVGSSGALRRFPIVAGVKQLVILVDHDTNGVGPADARAGATHWRRANRTAVLLTPKRAGADFNDLVREQA